MKNIAVIPARGGSKRVPRKNVREFCGKPIVAYSIAAALESGLFDSVIVSTDDAEIAETAERCGASVPFMRPAELCDDFTGVVAVVAHAIAAVDLQNASASNAASPKTAIDSPANNAAIAPANRVQTACLIYATAPFILAADLRRARAKLTAETDFVLSVARFEAPIFRALKMDAAGGVASIWREYETARSQDLPEAFHDAAQFCFGHAAAFLARKSIFNSRTIGCEIDRRRVQDIDTEADWARAEAMFKALNCAS